MDDHPPDRLSNDPGSPFYDAPALERGVGIRFKGVEKNNVEEYSVSEGWVRVAHATAKDRNGNPMTIKLSGVVEPHFFAPPSRNEWLYAVGPGPGGSPARRTFSLR
jgi:hypothetical protein